MKKIIALFSVAGSIVSMPALAVDSPWYGRIDTGYSWSSDMGKDLEGTDAGSSGILGIGIGYHINDHIRLDTTLGYRGWYKAEGSTSVIGTSVGGKANISSVVGLVNAYYDIDHYDRFTPYIGGGIGFSNNRVDNTDITIGGTPAGSISGNTNTSFSWQLSAGTAIEIIPGIAADIGYRYIDMGNVKTGDSAVIGGTPVTGATLRGSLKASEVQAGLRISF